MENRHTNILRTLPLAFVLVLIGTTLMAASTRACMTTTPANKRVAAGETAEYFVRVLNNEYVPGVTIKAEITQDISHYDEENTQFHIYFTQEDTMYITVYTEGVTADNISTDVILYEKGDNENEYREASGQFFTTFIDHPQDQSTGHGDSDDETPFVLIAVGGFSLVAVVGSCVHYAKEGSLPLVGGFSRLKRERVLKNEHRREVYELLCQYPEGLTFSEIYWAVEFSNKGVLHYQLRRLREFGFVKRSGKLYYPADVPMKRSFLEEIREAWSEGFRTPTEVARRIDSYPEKVRYHMKKEGLWKPRRYKKS